MGLPTPEPHHESQRQAQIVMSWNKDHPVVWSEGGKVYISVVFSWHLTEAYKRAEYWNGIGREVHVGGPAIVSSVQINALSHHNPDATFTSRGCPRKCSFCAVPRIEGPLVELEQWIPKPIICDNNLLACSKKHFNRVIDRLKGLEGVDFNQGLDARLLTQHHASRIAELNLKRVRLAFDHVRYEGKFLQAWDRLRKVGIPKRTIGVYVLIGYRDTPEDALYRLKVVKDLGSYPMPMRYQPLGIQKKNSHVDDNWTDWELTAYMRYWSSLRMGAIPFSEWLDYYRYRAEHEKQETLDM